MVFTFTNCFIYIRWVSVAFMFSCHWQLSILTVKQSQKNHSPAGSMGQWLDAVLSWKEGTEGYRIKNKYED